MSFDPFGQQPAPDSAPPPAGITPPADAAFLAARERVFFPAMLIIALAIINLLVALFQAFGFVQVAVVSAEKLHAQQIEMADKLAERAPWPAMRETAVRQAAETREKTPAQLKQQSLLVNGGMFLFLLIAPLLGLFGGVRMLQLRSYGLAMLASFVTAAPGLSLGGCCCIGQIVGLWAIWVLVSIDVRMAFR